MALFEGLIFGGAYLQVDIFMSKYGRKFTVFALFYFVFGDNFPSTSPYIWRGDLMAGFLHYWFGGLIFEGAYFRNFMVLLSSCHLNGLT